MSKKIAIIIVVVLLLLNFGAGYFLFYSARTKADDLTNSAKEATDNVSSQNDQIFALNGSLPKADVAGEDTEGLIRYKGAVRSAYTKAADSSVVTEYKVLAPVNVILSYYKTQLSKNDWILSSTAADNIIFIKNTPTIQTATMTAATAKGVTTYTLTVK